jgi:hypothetical protein
MCPAWRRGGQGGRAAMDQRAGVAASLCAGGRGAAAHRELREPVGPGRGSLKRPIGLPRGENGSSGKADGMPRRPSRPENRRREVHGPRVSGRPQRGNWVASRRAALGSRLSERLRPTTGEYTAILGRVGAREQRQGSQRKAASKVVGPEAIGRAPAWPRPAACHARTGHVANVRPDAEVASERRPRANASSGPHRERPSVVAAPSTRKDQGLSPDETRSTRPSQCGLPRTPTDNATSRTLRSHLSGVIWRRTGRMGRPARESISLVGRPHIGGAVGKSRKAGDLPEGVRPCGSTDCVLGRPHVTSGSAG